MEESLYVKGLERMTFDPPERSYYRTVETWVNKNSGSHTVQEKVFDEDAAFEDWLRTSNRAEHSGEDKGTPVFSGLRLVIQECFYSHLRPVLNPGWLPFKRDVFIRMMEAFRLPRDFPWVFGLPLGRLPRLRRPGNESDQVWTLAATTPRTTQNWLSMALSFDAKTGFTSAYIVLKSDYSLWPIDEILMSIRLATAQSANPLFLPSVLTLHFAERLRGFLYSLLQELYRVETCTGLVDVSPVYQAEQAIEIDTAYRSLVVLHEHLCAHNFDYAVRFVTSLKHELAQFREYTSKTMDQYDHQDTDVVEHYVDICEGMATGQTAERARMKELIEMQLKVLYHLMQTRDTQLTIQLANDSRRDSRTMKIITIITAVYLPGTFLSGIFGMNLFDFDSNGIHVSNLFWLYWSILIPLTGITLVSWLAWVNRSKILPGRFAAKDEGESGGTTQGTANEEPKRSDPTTQLPSSGGPGPAATSIHSTRSFRRSIAEAAQISRRNTAAMSSNHSLHRTSTIASQLTSPAAPTMPAGPFAATIPEDSLTRPQMQP